MKGNIVGLVDDAQALRHWEEVVASARSILMSNGFNDEALQVVEAPAAIKTLVDEALPYLDFDIPYRVKTFSFPELGTYEFVEKLTIDHNTQVDDVDIAFACSFSVKGRDFFERCGDYKEWFDSDKGRVYEHWSYTEFENRECNFLVFDDGSVSFLRRDRHIDYEPFYYPRGMEYESKSRDTELTYYPGKDWRGKIVFPGKPTWGQEHPTEEELRELLRQYIVEHGIETRQETVGERRRRSVGKLERKIEQLKQEEAKRQQEIADEERRAAEERQRLQEEKERKEQRAKKVKIVRWVIAITLALALPFLGVWIGWYIVEDGHHTGLLFTFFVLLGTVSVIVYSQLLPSP